MQSKVSQVVDGMSLVLQTSMEVGRKRIFSKTVAKTSTVQLVQNKLAGKLCQVVVAKISICAHRRPADLTCAFSRRLLIDNDDFPFPFLPVSDNHTGTMGHPAGLRAGTRYAYVRMTPPNNEQKD